MVNQQIIEWIKKQQTNGYSKEQIFQYLITHGYNQDEVRQAVLLDMIFNLGMARLGYFKKMFRALSEGEYYKASIEMLDSLWASQVKRRAIKLAQMMKDGDLNVAS